ncbi:MAG: septum site-determining protein MinC [Shewanella sp.]|nr:septum site-determining protein MinC [Shewanella sp.]MCF1431002.1 septum site-determining protein MinC [Shewanella sp.]MCF1458060.1 septum site-determining protein MinC [Shewanella sp.]
MTTPNLELKGASFTLSVLHLYSTDLDIFATELAAKLSQAPQFFLGAPLVINLSGINATELDIQALQQIMKQLQLVLLGFTGANDALAKQIRKAGLALLKTGKTVVTPPPLPQKTRIVKQNIRSGQQIYAQSSDLIIFGNVGNGAEVIADGNIHIFGALRGKAMAGAKGNRHAVILARKLEAELVSVAGQYWLSENLTQHTDSTSGCIRLDGDSLVFETLPL